MLLVKSGLKKQEIVELLDGKTHDGITLKHVGTSGLIISFEIVDGDKSKAKNIVRDLIKSQSYGGALYFSVEVK